MQTEDVINKLRAMKLFYIQNSIGKNPAALPGWLEEFVGYASFLYDHYGDFLDKYERKEAEIVKSESENREKAIANGEKMTVTEMEQRIGVRLGTLKGKRKRLEQVVKGVTLHINVCQSLMKNWGDEAKGMR